MKKYKNKYRTDSTRLKSWDYKNPWWYYVTICTNNHKEWFGEILNSKMMLNDLGKMASEYWLKIPFHYPEVELDEFIIMPNHLHGIIILNELPSVETPYMVSLQGNKQHSLGDVIGKYKAAVTRQSRKMGYKQYHWQPRFYDRIIRNERELFQIRKYVQQNPLKWEIEKDFPENMDIL